jgi:hypothetical protein
VAAKPLTEATLAAGLAWPCGAPTARTGRAVIRHWVLLGLLVAMLYVIDSWADLVAWLAAWGAVGTFMWLDDPGAFRG